MFLRALMPSICIFDHVDVLDNTGESAFQFLVRYGCIKSGKIKRLYVCHMVESLRFKMFLKLL